MLFLNVMAKEMKTYRVVEIEQYRWDEMKGRVQASFHRFSLGEL